MTPAFSTYIHNNAGAILDRIYLYDRSRDTTHYRSHILFGLVCLFFFNSSLCDGGDWSTFIKNHLIPSYPPSLNAICKCGDDRARSCWRMREHCVSFRGVRLLAASFVRSDSPRRSSTTVSCCGDLHSEREDAVNRRTAAAAKQHIVASGRATVSVIFKSSKPMHAIERAHARQHAQRVRIAQTCNHNSEAAVLIHSRAARTAKHLCNVCILCCC